MLGCSTFNNDLSLDFTVIGKIVINIITIGDVLFTSCITATRYFWLTVGSNETDVK